MRPGLGLRLLAVELGGEVTVDVGSGGVEAAEVLVHDLNLRLQHLVLLVRLAGVVRVALETLHLAVQAALGVLGAFDVVDGWKGDQSRKEEITRIGQSPFVSISHLLALVPPLDGTALFKSSNRSFISLRRLRSAIL